MHTGLQSTFFNRNRIVTKEDLGDYFMEYFRGSLDVFLEDVLYPEAGLFQAVNLIAAGADKFSLSGYSSPTGMADGHILDVAEDTGYIAGVQFENANGIPYHVALQAGAMPVGVDISPLDGTPRIKYLKEIIGGEADSPNGITDNLDGTLTMVVDGITEVNVDNTGRYVLVAKYPDLAAGATEEAIAWQIALVSWSGTQNEITTSDSPAGAGYFGQTTPSTTNGDYIVMLLGPLVKRNTDLSGSGNWAYLGTVTGTGAGNPPAVFDITEQVVFGVGGISNLWQITRTANIGGVDRLKVDVKAIAAEENTNESQLRVSGWDGGGNPITVFDCDELGNVDIQGDLTVQGETTQEDLVTINASEIVTDNLTLGDADSDDHLIKGEWTHYNVTDARNVFVIDGATGHIGVGGNHNVSYDVVIYGTGDTEKIQLYCTPTSGVIDVEARDFNLDVSNCVLDASGEVSLVSGNQPSLGFWDEIESADERRWGFRCVGSSMQMGVVRDDAGAWGAVGIEIERSTTSLGVMTLKPTEVSIKTANDPKLGFWDEGEGADEKRWSIYMSGGTLAISPMTDAGVPSATTAVSFLRTAEDMTQFKVTVPSTELECSTEVVCDTPKLQLYDAAPQFELYDTNGGADAKIWQMGSEYANLLEFRTRTDAGAVGATWLLAERDGTAVDRIELEANDQITLTGGAGAGLGIRINNDLVPYGGTKSLGQSGYEWTYFFMSDTADEGMATNLVPRVAQSHSLGNFDFATDTGYRWAGVFAADIFTMNISGEGGYHWRDIGAAADEKHWFLGLDSGDLVLATRQDEPITKGSGTDVFKITRGTGTAVTRIDFYKPTYVGATLFTQTVSPISQHNYYVGSYGDEFLEVSAKDIVASHTAPRFIMRETDQIGTGVDRENWGMVATGGDLLIGAYNSARTSMNPGIYLHRASGDSYVIDSVEIVPSILTTDSGASTPFCVKGVSTKAFFFDLDSNESGLGVNEGRWRFTTTDDGAGDFVFKTMTDGLAWSGNNVFRVQRLSGTNVGSWYSYVDIVPDTDGSVDLGAISPSDLRFGNGYFSGNVEAGQLRASGTGSYKATFNTLTGVRVAVTGTSGNSTIQSTAVQVNTGWIKFIASNGDTGYIPYYPTT